MGWASEAPKIEVTACDIIVPKPERAIRTACTAKHSEDDEGDGKPWEAKQHAPFLGISLARLRRLFCFCSHEIRPVRKHRSSACCTSRTVEERDGGRHQLLCVAGWVGGAESFRDGLLLSERNKKRSAVVGGFAQAIFAHYSLGVAIAASASASSLPDAAALHARNVAADGNVAHLLELVKSFERLHARCREQCCETLGAGEILLNCVDMDGQKDGFDLGLVEAVMAAVTIPVIASSGAGAVEHFSEVFEATGVQAALAAGIFHRKEVSITEVKDHLAEKGVPARRAA